MLLDIEQVDEHLTLKKIFRSSPTQQGGPSTSDSILLNFDTDVTLPLVSALGHVGGMYIPQSPLF